MLRPKWETLLRRYFNVGLPDNYICFDAETTGFKKDFDVAIDFGWTLVDDRRAVDRGHMILDWTRRPEWFEPELLKEKLFRIRSEYRQKGINWDYTFERLQAEGEDPLFVLNFAHDLLQEASRVGHKNVGHNSFTFDVPLFTAMFNEFLDSPWPVPEADILDTGCLEKAAVSRDILDPNYHLVPDRGETPASFFKRCFNRRLPGVKWNIDECCRRYELKEKHGFDYSGTHGAEMDSYALHLMLELNRE